MVRFVVISGCSGGGKSTLLEELGRRGHNIVEEPGRRIVRAEVASGGSALPWVDARAFVDRAIQIAQDDYRAAQANAGWTFFDRGLVDAISGLGSIEGWLSPERLAGFPYHPQVFLTPPWPEIYETDTERRHGLAEAVEEYGRLCRDFPALGYEVIEIARRPVKERADFVLRTLGLVP